MPKFDTGVNVEILRGWPGDGALDQAMPIAASTTLSNGDVVVTSSDGISVTKVPVGGGTGNGAVGLVVRGNGDTSLNVGSSVNSNKAVVLWSNYVARIKQAYVYKGSAVAIGDPLTAGGTNGLGIFRVGTPGTDPIIGYVIGITAASTLNDASYTILIR